MSKYSIIILLLLSTSVAVQAQIGTAIYNMNINSKSIYPIVSMIDRTEDSDISYTEFQSTQSVTVGKTDFFYKDSNS